MCQSVGHPLTVTAFFFLGFDFFARAWLLGVMMGAVVVGIFAGKWLLKRALRALFERLLEGVLAALAVALLAEAL